ncbi:hypothetical protein BS47DRAFT_493916 [Hydnum rufescens UP504]|uniref:Uncharacterized protein n=1 Tax=Hydnum rufescens UP504 TaxID=1448309 RepID=A0A9P6AHH9_9AGAM|nr:hypothetical protein BS47DRAFT_493916 [Hydnum rufescens UP504]
MRIDTHPAHALLVLTTLCQIGHPGLSYILMACIVYPRRPELSTMWSLCLVVSY